MMDIYYTEITFIVVLVSAALLLIVSTNNLLSKSRKRSVSQFALLLMVVACVEWLGVFLNEKPANTIFLHAVVKALEYSLMPYLCIQFLNITDMKEKNKWVRESFKFCVNRKN